MTMKETIKSLFYTAVFAGALLKSANAVYIKNDITVYNPFDYDIRMAYSNSSCLGENYWQTIIVPQRSSHYFEFYGDDTNDGCYNSSKWFDFLTMFGTIRYEVQLSSIGFFGLPGLYQNGWVSEGYNTEQSSASAVCWTAGIGQAPCGPGQGWSYSASGYEVFHTEMCLGFSQPGGTLKDGSKCCTVSSGGSCIESASN